jgi:hypothetical protein
MAARLQKLDIARWPLSTSLLPRQIQTALNPQNPLT